MLPAFKLDGLLILSSLQAQPNASLPHWPWWLRVIALLAVLVFIRVVVTYVRGAGRSR
jgi:hypothetical protein